jgi:manganese/zinc/iron transport system permease protein
MLGDAISHAVLPGIVLAFLISGGRDNIIILIGASAAGLLVTLLIELLHKKVRLQEDASIGISFTWLFAIGVILISVYTEQVDLDQDCVLYGEIAYVPLDLIYFSGGKVFFPRAALIAGSLFTVALTFVMVAYKGLKITSFNSDYARSLGISTLAWHLVFMSLVSVTTVLSFEIVGAILIVALLVVPPATAYLLTKRLKQMLILSLLFACLSAIGGYYLALVLDASIAGAMVTVAGFFFLLALIFTRLRRSSLKVDMRL